MPSSCLSLSLYVCLPITLHCFTFSYLEVFSHSCLQQQWKINAVLFNPTIVIALYNICFSHSPPKTREKKTKYLALCFLSTWESICVFPDEHRLNSARLCLIILTCIAEVGAATLLQHLHPPHIDFVLTSPLCMIGPVRRCLSSWWQYELQSQSPQNGEFLVVSEWKWAQYW